MHSVVDQSDSSRLSMVSDNRSDPRPLSRSINPSRERRKKELLLLRQQVIALQERLTAIQLGEETRELPEETMRVAWRTVAQDQRDQRHDSERTQKKLRTLIKTHKLSIQSVHRYLQRIKFPEDFVRSHIPVLPFYDVEAEAAFTKIGRMLRTLRTEMNTVIHKSSLKRLIDSVQKVVVDHDVTPSLTVKTLDSRFVPSDAETKAHAVWAHCHSKEVLHSVGIDEVRVPTMVPRSLFSV